MTALPPPNAGRSDGESLYAELGVARDSTLKEIEAGVRVKLATIAANAALSPIERRAAADRLHFAYSVLSDTLKRRIYDTAGEGTVLYLEESVALHAAREFGLHLTIVIVALVVTLALVSELVTTVLLSVHYASGGVSLHDVAVPLYILGVTLIVTSGIALLLWCCSEAEVAPKAPSDAVMSTLPSQLSPNTPSIAIFTVLFYGAALITLATLVATDAKRIEFAVPPLITAFGEIMFVASWADGLRREMIVANMHRFGFQVYSEANVLCVRLCRCALLFSRAAAQCLLALRIAEVFVCTWFVVFIPGLFFCGGAVCGGVNMLNIRRKQTVERGVNPNLKFPILLLLCYTTSASLLSYKLDHWSDEDSNLPLWGCLLPMWILIAVFVFGLMSLVFKICGQDVSADA